MRTLRIAGLVLVTLMAMGCEKSSGAAQSGPSAAAQPGAVEVPAQGKKFEPPIKPEQLPAGAWYCDMGTVHYARMEKGDGSCPVCKMDLKQKK